MENDVAESSVMKADNGKELKFSDCVKELQSGIKIYMWQLEPQVEKLRYHQYNNNCIGKVKGLYGH